MASNKKLPIKGNLTRKEIAENLIKARNNTPVPAKKRTTKELTGKAAIDAYQRSIRPENIAKENLAAKKALEKKYPGMFLPSTRDTAGIHKKK